ncbi:RDD family protein [Oerskovia sp. M15]
MIAITTEREFSAATQRAAFPGASGRPGTPGLQDGLAGVPVAGVGRRLVAFLVDSAVIGVVVGRSCSVGWRCSGSPHGRSDRGHPVAGRRPPGQDDDAVRRGGVLGLLYWLSIWFWEGRTGKTLGNLATGIRTVRAEDRSPVGFGRAALRWIVTFLGAVICIGELLVILSPAFDRSGLNQGWQDKLAKALVLDVRPQAAVPGRPPSPLRARPTASLPARRTASPARPRARPTASLPARRTASPARPRARPTARCSRCRCRLAPKPSSRPPGCSSGGSLLFRAVLGPRPVVLPELRRPGRQRSRLADHGCARHLSGTSRRPAEPGRAACRAAVGPDAPEPQGPLRRPGLPPRGRSGRACCVDARSSCRGPGVGLDPPERERHPPRGRAAPSSAPSVVLELESGQRVALGDPP